MGKYYIIYNPFAGNNTGTESAKGVEKYFGDNCVYTDIVEISKDYKKFFSNLAPDDKIVLCGGDGTINRFANDTDGIEFSNDILYYPCGSGNDFYHDLGKKAGDEPVLINGYIKNLPEVEINGKKRKFINGIGYGIDGYCCEVGDEMRKKSNKPINYAMIAVKGLLFHYKPTNAVVTVDGVRREFKKVWLSPTMNGKFYGGGMMPTPAQDRLNEEGKISVLVWHGSGKISTLAAFPGIFKGEHIKNEKMCEVLVGNSVTVEFDRPVAAQIDGETVLNVSTYTASAKIKAAVK